MISSTPALQDCLQHARTHGAVAIDTEFVWDETYYPGLGLVQLGISPDAAWLIDAPALADPAPVGALLADPGIIKVLHDARQDLCILKDWSGGAPRTIFDTRLAAGFCGYSSQLSLQALLREVLGVELEKSETRTNWLRRPLSARQIAYALDDVRHMLELRDRLLALAGEAGTLAWLKEEMQGLDDPALYQARPPAETWARVKDAGRLNAQGLAVLCELAALREETAREHNLPRTWVMADALLVTMAERPPLAAADLLAIRGLNDRQRSRLGEGLIAACRCALEKPRQQWPRLESRHLDEAAKKQTDVALAWLKDRGAALKVDPALFGSRAEVGALISTLAAGKPESALPLLRGWRFEAAGRDLLAHFSLRGSAGFHNQ